MENNNNYPGRSDNPQPNSVESGGIGLSGSTTSRSYVNNDHGSGIDFNTETNGASEAPYDPDATAPFNVTAFLNYLDHFDRARSNILLDCCDFATCPHHNGDYATAD